MKVRHDTTLHLGYKDIENKVIEEEFECAATQGDCIFHSIHKLAGWAVGDQNIIGIGVDEQSPSSRHCA